MKVHLRIILWSIYRCMLCAPVTGVSSGEGGCGHVCLPMCMRAVYACVSCVSGEETPSSDLSPSPFMPKMQL